MCLSCLLHCSVQNLRKQSSNSLFAVLTAVLVLVDLMLSVFVNAGLFYLHRPYFFVLLFLFPFAWLLCHIFGTWTPRLPCIALRRRVPPQF